MNNRKDLIEQIANFIQLPVALVPKEIIDAVVVNSGSTHEDFTLISNWNEVTKQAFEDSMNVIDLDYPELTDAERESASYNADTCTDVDAGQTWFECYSATMESMVEEK